MKKTFALIVFFVFSLHIFCTDTKAEPYTKDEFHPWLHQLRRSEIVTLGSLPFTTLTTSLGYSFYRYFANDFDPEFQPNPFSPSQANLSIEEQKRILYISLSASLLVGIIDFTISMIKKNKSQIEIEQKQEPYIIKKIIIEAEN